MSTQTNEHTDTGGAQPPTRRTDELLSMLAERMGAHFGATSVFAAPVERDGVTVIGVANVRFGMGGGSGSDPTKGGEGEGAGGGGTMSASGYIELKNGRSRFVPVVHPERMVALACLMVIAALVTRRPASARRARSLPWR
jgi:uncharacterized spore protein YtfJ